ncbi:protein of unknown function [Legionella fallonii LLAP-10]|uniref:Uncharacterized protein n=1 Tax=Legionella fallonii LLAP-10 TaxID=1212491 RepID=A0A098G8Z9_9GAMM|nr:protein of unknown function [Legionella fallonii LLAP-10]
MALAVYAAGIRIKGSGNPCSGVVPSSWRAPLDDYNRAYNFL